ncbi:hypothetical protein K6R62_004794, partial [Escherichia coli]|nr:hypothetical protein [Escherichia coli]
DDKFITTDYLQQCRREGIDPAIQPVDSPSITHPVPSFTHPTPSITHRKPSITHRGVL